MELRELKAEKIKVICDKNFSKFAPENKFIEIENLINYKKIIEVVEDTELLFIVTDEIQAERISKAVSKKIDLILLILREKDQLHVKRYLFEKADATTVIPYSKSQNAICLKIIQAISNALRQNKIEFDEVKKFFKNSKYFSYYVDGMSDNLKSCGEFLQIENVLFKTGFNDLDENMNVKIMSGGKNHCTGKILEMIAYDDINDLKSDRDIKNALKGFLSFSFLIIEPDRKNLKKYRQIVKVARNSKYPRPFIISVPLDDSIKMNNVHINLTVSDREKFYNDFICKFDRRLKYDDDEIQNLLKFRNVKANFFDFEIEGENNELKNFLEDFSGKNRVIFVNFEFSRRDDRETKYKIEEKVMKFLDVKIKNKFLLLGQSFFSDNEKSDVYISIYEKILSTE